MSIEEVPSKKSTGSQEGFWHLSGQRVTDIRTWRLHSHSDTALGSRYLSKHNMNGTSVARLACDKRWGCIERFPIVLVLKTFACL